MNRFSGLLFQNARLPWYNFQKMGTFSRRLCTHRGIYGSQHESWHATTICAIRKGGEVCMVGDGQVSLGDTVLKPNATKVRKIGDDTVITGFAGATADCFTLLDRLETKLEQYPGQLLRASVELAKQWRTDKYLRHLEAMIIACDKDVSLTITGNGDVVEPKDGVIAIGSGGLYAASAARALMDSNLTAREIATKSMNIAADTCVYTNHNFITESLLEDKKSDESSETSTKPTNQKDGMFIVLVNCDVKSEFVEEFKKATIENASQSVKESGVVRFDLMQVQGDENQHRFSLLECYSSPSGLDAHKETKHYAKWQELVEPWMAKPRTKEIYSNVWPSTKYWSWPSES